MASNALQDAQELLGLMGGIHAEETSSSISQDVGIAL